MGLDMFLSTRKVVRNEVGYWRKQNQIHNWFVENVQDGEDECNEFVVSIEKMIDLLEICLKILLVNSEAKSAAEFYIKSLRGKREEEDREWKAYIADPLSKNSSELPKLSVEDVGNQDWNNIIKPALDNLSAHINETLGEDQPYDEAQKDFGKEFKKEINLAKKLLPTKSGFFFGSTEYDSYLFSGILNTAFTMHNALITQLNNPEVEITYQSSW